jgi:hypothetical protein
MTANLTDPFIIVSSALIIFIAFIWWALRRGSDD